MTKGLKNPFNITKATDFNDQQINDFWVDISPNSTFASLIKPTSPMPMLVLGGKGSGKTHLMRYFSYPLQRIRYKENILAGIKDDGYIGIYMRCGGLNSGRFNGGGYDKQSWSTIFEYYMEMWLSQLLIKTICDALKKANEHNFVEDDLVRQIRDLFNVKITPTPNNLTDILCLLKNSLKRLDNIINNCSLSCKLTDAQIDVNRGALLFGIPKIIKESIPIFHNCLFVYLIDEFENLLEYQQRYFNTLIREKESPATFKIGARLYGVKTYSTFSGEEENKEGSEYETLWIDDRLRNNPEYKVFAKRMIVKRLITECFIQENVDANDMLLDNFFCTKESADNFETNQLSFLKDKESIGRSYFKRFEKKIKEAFPENKPTLESIIGNLVCSEYPILEKLNLFFIYRAWSKNEDLLEKSKIIRSSCANFIRDQQSEPEYSDVYNHFKSDLLAQILRENGKHPPYYGISTLIDMSWGLPRNLLILLKNIYSWAVFFGEKPFREDKISIEAQEKGILDSSEWFFRDAKKSGKDGVYALESVRRLGTLLEKIRYSDKPSECSITAFSGDFVNSSIEAKRIIDVVNKWSLLIDVSERFDRNTGERFAKKQINRMLAPKWGLSIKRRGEITLTGEEINAIFDPDFSSQFPNYLRQRIEPMNAPWPKRASKKINQMSLFTESDDDN